jgi:hypothetical protein
MRGRGRLISPLKSAMSGTRLRRALIITPLTWEDRLRCVVPGCMWGCGERPMDTRWRHRSARDPGAWAATARVLSPSGDGEKRKRLFCAILAHGDITGQRQRLALLVLRLFRRAGHAGHLMAGRNEEGNQLAADHPGGSGEVNAHRSLTLCKRLIGCGLRYVLGELLLSSGLIRMRRIRGVRRRSHRGSLPGRSGSLGRWSGAGWARCGRTRRGARSRWRRGRP